MSVRKGIQCYQLETSCFPASMSLKEMGNKLYIKVNYGSKSFVAHLRKEVSLLSSSGIVPVKLLFERSNSVHVLAENKTVRNLKNAGQF